MSDFTPDDDGEIEPLNDDRIKLALHFAITTMTVGSLHLRILGIAHLSAPAEAEAVLSDAVYAQAEREDVNPDEVLTQLVLAVIKAEEGEPDGSNGGLS